MGPAEVAPAEIAPRAAQGRVIAAALDLFAQHGVGGTSLQMIADAIGVTKAAVYHQYKSKDEIVIAAAATELARLETALTAAEAEPTPARARARMVAEMVDLAVARRHLVGSLLSDPVIGRHFAGHAPFHRVMDRLSRVLVGDEAGPEARIQTAVLTAAISGAVVHPLVADLDDATLRAQLVRLAQGILNS